MKVIGIVPSYYSSDQKYLVEMSQQDINRVVNGNPRMNAVLNAGSVVDVSEIFNRIREINRSGAELATIRTKLQAVIDIMQTIPENIAVKHLEEEKPPIKMEA